MAAVSVARCNCNHCGRYCDYPPTITDTSKSYSIRLLLVADAGAGAAAAATEVYRCC